ncbi:MAG TPA: transcription-repair coupling factor [Bacillota bacterium]
MSLSPSPQRPELKEFNRVRTALDEGARQQLVYGLTGSQKAYFLAEMARATERPLFVLVSHLTQAERLKDDLATLLGGREVDVFPAVEILPYQVVAHSPELFADRLRVLWRLGGGGSPIVIAPVGAVLPRLMPRERFNTLGVDLKWGDRLDLDLVVESLAAMAYERVDVVEGKGQFSVRGGIVDLFSPVSDQPWRVEFFDDEIDSIRLFDPVSQRSLTNLQSIRVTPAREMIFPEGGRDEALKAIRRELEASLRRLTKADLGKPAQALRERVEAHLERLENAGDEGLESYAPFFFPHLETIIDYLPPRAVVVLDDPLRIKEAADESERVVAEMYGSSLERGEALPTQAAVYQGYDDFWARAKERPVIYLSLLLRKFPAAEPDNLVAVEARPGPSFQGQREAFVAEAKRYAARNDRVVLVASTVERAQRLASIIREEGLPAQTEEAWTIPEPARFAAVVGSLETGFEFPAIGLVVLTDDDIFGRVKRRTKPRTAREGLRLASYQDLKIGDYVVHVSHGIGRYLGLRTLEIQGKNRDYLYVQYAGEDRLYVPTDQIDLVQKYIGAEGQEPKVYKLGGMDWAKVKNRVKASVRQMAEELLRLYAVRQATPGHAFGPDTVWQHEFEEAFRFEETPDQLQATAEIKADMEKPQPMERLLCGDVGYGKTEVAIRAAFKAVMDGKQVAVLVPTTILAAQHFNTFRDRFAGYPVKIELLSRFRSAAEQKKAAAAARKGAADVVIGTHRLLSEDVHFKDLGLLIIDEEQRFGVAHKERLKKLKETVDVLVLSATPIPRTMHMAMIGIRDMSVIETPPEDRYPVQTYVVEYSDELVREAIQRELDRGGQVYYVHNRVQTIDRVAARIQRLVPEARVAVGHGQMNEDDLERIMLDFMNGEEDVLACTSIIENGLDISNVNTLVVEESDHLGLAQLYQLRGRVGRSNRLAYAYFTYRRDKVITETAEKRLEAIKEFTEFGSGFKIALRDMEIRGAGNILGPEQHGHILSVGFDLYAQMLEEAVLELRGEKRPEVIEPSIELPIDAYVDDGYVPDSRQKIELYKKISVVEDQGDADEILDEVRDRFGDPPQAVQNLLGVARIKALAKKLGVVAVVQQKGIVQIKFGPMRRLSLDSLSDLSLKHRDRIVLSPQKAAPVLLIKVQGLEEGRLLEAVEGVLAQAERFAVVV